MDPLKQFLNWYRRAEQAKENFPDAMALASVSKSSKPSVRFVLFKGLDKNRIRFVTNYRSRKAKDFEKNPFASLAVFWPKLYLQVRVEGKVSKLAAKESDLYWKTRSRLSQLSAWASPQSEKIPDRHHLQKQLKAFTKKFEDQEVPRPAHWGGYALVPTQIEFWTGQKHRLHDREVFVRRKGGWIKYHLAP